MKKYLLPIFILLISLKLLHAAGSAVGAVDMREAKINICLPDNMESQAGSLRAWCHPDGKPDLKKNAYFTRIASPANGNTAECIFADLDPGTKYEYAVEDSKAQKLFSGVFSTKPDFKDRTPPPDFTFAVLGSNYVNDKTFDPPFRTPGAEYEIYEAVKNAKPAFVIWADGLNVLRNADVGSRSGIFSRYRAARAFKNINAILESHPNYAVMSASNFGKNNPDASSASRHAAAEAFRSFWSNPEYAVEGIQAYTFNYSDAQFFVLDDCSARSNLDYKQDKPYILGSDQSRWLKNALENSQAKFKIIVINSPFANPVKSKTNFTFAAEERKDIMDFLSAKKIGGVVFLSANKEYGEATRLVRAGAYPLIDITAAPLTDRPAAEIEELNYFRMPGSGITKRAFLMAKIDGPENERAISFTFVDSQGKPLFTTSVKEQELYKFE